VAINLYPHQAGAVDSIDKAIAEGCRRIMVQAPTAFGKTVLAAYLAKRIREQRKCLLFTVPALTLVDQTVMRFAENGIDDVGVIQAQHWMTDYSRPVQIASIQTLQRRKIPPADLVLIDEAHRWFDFYGDWFADPRWADVPFIGLSATPWTKGLGKYYDKLIIASTTQELIDLGYLSNFKVFAPWSPDLKNVRIVAGDFHEGDLSKVMGKAQLVADVIDTWIDRAQNRPTLCFAVDRAHAKHLQGKFQEAGVTAGYIDAFTPTVKRETVREQFHAGIIKVVCNVGCLTTGVDWDVRCIILARPTRSVVLFVQMVGRGLRTANGKDHCLILDHSDNHLRLGFVTDIHHDELNDGRMRPKAKAKDVEKLPKKCLQCAFLKPPKTLECPSCGFVPNPKCNVVAADGELIELENRRKAAAIAETERELFYRELKQYCHFRNHNQGWVWHQFNAKFRHPPPKHYERLHPTPPRPGTLGWIKSRQIAYAKRRRVS
jgi:DNA repair protein RadD